MPKISSVHSECHVRCGMFVEEVHWEVMLLRNVNFVC